MNPFQHDDPIPDGDPIPDDESLSAYLDGELPADERARIERLLAESPESRQLLDELRALHGTLEAVPRYRLEDDFATRVLRAAERAMLSGESFLDQTGSSAQSDDNVRAQGDAVEANGRSPEAGTPAPASLQTSAWSSREAGWSWQRSRRAIIWPVLALAAGLLIMLALPDAPQERNVALAPSNAKTDAASREAVSLRKVPARDRADQDAKSAIGETDRPMPFTADADQDAAQEANEDAAATSNYGSPPSATATAPQSLGAGGGVPSGGKPSRGTVSPAPPGGALGMPGRTVPGRTVPGRTVPGSTAPMADKKHDEPAEPEGRRGTPRLEVADDDQPQGAPTVDNTLLIVCDVASDVVDRPEFQQILAKHNIILEQASDELRKGVNEETSPLRDEKATGAASEEKDNETDGDRELSRFLERRRAFGAAQGEEREAAFDALGDALQGGEAESLLLEATEDQLEAVVADFERQSELFLSVEVHPAPDIPEQQALTAFNRSRAAAILPAGPSADDATPDSPPAPAEAPQAKVGDDTEPKDSPGAAPAAAGETAEVAAPVVKGRAKRLETRKLAELKQATDENVKSETAAAAKVGAQPSSKTTPTGRKPTRPAVNEDARDTKAKTRSDPDDKSKQADVSDVAETLSEKGKPGSDVQGDKARKAANGASAPRHAIFILRHIPRNAPPNAIDPASPENP